MDSSQDDDWDFLTEGEEVEKDNGDSESPVIKLLNRQLDDALELEASHLHFQPGVDSMAVRIRVDGALSTWKTIPKIMERALVGRIKVISGMDLTERRRPQTGFFELQNERQTRFRVESAPTLHGEAITLSIWQPGDLTRSLDNLGLSKKNRDGIQRIVNRSPCLVLIAGPTGSGRGTLLRSLVLELQNSEKQFTSIESPIRGELVGVNQMEVNSTIGCDMERLLASARRQDIDVLMCSALDTVEVCQQVLELVAGGCSVLAGFPTSEAVATITRLRDMGLDPGLVSSMLSGVIGLRLVRKICDECRESYEPADEELEMLGTTREQLNNGMLSRGNGCKACRNLGYKGRTGLHEVLEIDDSIRSAIWQNAPADDLIEIARKSGFTSLREDGSVKASEGITTTLEVLQTSR